jgi:uncharacterized membrane protein YagU involved in acid resistance
MAVSLVRREWVTAGFGAGIVSGITLALFSAFAQRKAGNAVSGTYRFLADVVAGPQATGASWAVPLGVAVLFACTILWAFGYLYAAQKQPQLLARPLISGIGFGVIVWFVMQALLVPVGRFTQPTIYTFDRDIVAFTVFFGIPLAFTAARLTRAR